VFDLAHNRLGSLNRDVDRVSKDLNDGDEEKIKPEKFTFKQ
jgi:hypothetical protein